MKPIEFRGLNYYTEYSSTGIYEHGLCKEVCFGPVFRAANGMKGDPRYGKYEMVVFKSREKVDKSYNNFCYVDIAQYMKYLLDVVDFEYSIKNNDNVYTIIMTITAPPMLHIFLLTCVRYLYEYPYNVILYDAMRIKELNMCEGFNINDLYNLVCKSCFSDADSLHAIPSGGSSLMSRLSKKDIWNRSISCKSLNSFYPYLRKNLYKDQNFRSLIIENQHNTFFKRLPIYLENYNFILQNE
jgi:hypothetical protein